MKPTPHRLGVSIGSYKLFDVVGRTTGNEIIAVGRMQVGQSAAESSWYAYDDWLRNSQHFTPQFQHLRPVAGANSHHLCSSVASHGRPWPARWPLSSCLPW